MEAGKLPVLAVCRGIQILNVAAAARCTRTWPRRCPRPSSTTTSRLGAAAAGSYLATSIDVGPRDTRLGPSGRDGRGAVNSMHHQAVKDLAPGLRATAFAPDGIIEARRIAQRALLVAVQWHPEALAERDPVMRTLFSAFVEESGR